MLYKSKSQRQNITPEKIAKLLNENYFKLIPAFYEMQSEFLRVRYKIYGGLETSNIIICFIKDALLAIFRQREQDLEYNISLKKFFENTQKIKLPAKKIISIVNNTGIPKETVRRKIKKLIQKDYINSISGKEYFLNITTKNKDNFLKIMEKDINSITNFVYIFNECLNLDLSKKLVENEIQKQFSFYFYHFLSCELNWIKLWQKRIKDIDLLFITMQALIPTLKATGSNIDSDQAVSATSISDISGIPRATCIRKLHKLVSLGILVREIKTKRYYINQTVSEKTKYINSAEHVITTAECFCEFLSTTIKALILTKA